MVNIKLQTSKSKTNPKQKIPSPKFQAQRPKGRIPSPKFQIPRPKEKKRIYPLNLACQQAGLGLEIWGLGLLSVGVLPLLGEPAYRSGRLEGGRYFFLNSEHTIAVATATFKDSAPAVLSGRQAKEGIAIFSVTKEQISSETPSVSFPKMINPFSLKFF